MSSFIRRRVESFSNNLVSSHCYCVIDVHSLMSSVQRILCQPRLPLPGVHPWITCFSKTVVLPPNIPSLTTLPSQRKFFPDLQIFQYPFIILICVLSRNFSAILYAAVSSMTSFSKAAVEKKSFRYFFLMEGVAYIKSTYDLYDR